MWFLNRQRDIVDGKNSQILSNGVDSKLRDDLERLKKIRAHRGLRHFWGLRVRGQHTKTTGLSISDTNHVSTLLMPLICRSPWKDGRCVEEAWLNTFYLYLIRSMNTRSLCLISLCHAICNEGLDNLM